MFNKYAAVATAALVATAQQASAQVTAPYNRNDAAIQNNIGAACAALRVSNGTQYAQFTPPIPLTIDGTTPLSTTQTVAQSPSGFTNLTRATVIDCTVEKVAQQVELAKYNSDGQGKTIISLETRPVDGGFNSSLGQQYLLNETGAICRRMTGVGPGQQFANSCTPR